jgi:hypothetical protein
MLQTLKFHPDFSISRDPCIPSPSINNDHLKSSIKDELKLGKIPIQIIRFAHDLNGGRRTSIIPNRLTGG